jgi:hypothetical protein
VQLVRVHSSRPSSPKTASDGPRCLAYEHTPRIPHLGAPRPRPPGPAIKNLLHIELRRYTQDIDIEKFLVLRFPSSYNDTSSAARVLFWFLGGLCWRGCKSFVCRYFFCRPSSAAHRLGTAHRHRAQRQRSTAHGLPDPPGAWCSSV